MAISKTGKIFLFLGGILAALLIVAIIALVYAAKTMGRPDVPDNSVLVLNISGELPDYVAEEPLAKAFGIKQQQSFTSLLTQLRKAKVDKRIGAVLLDINFPGIGWGKAFELREAIADFKTSGKPVYAYMEIGTNREYYIATAADKIYLPPSGDIYINGFAAEAMFYKGSLDKLGVEADVIQIGPKYKNAPDRYTRKEMSDGQREVINAVLDEYFARFTAAIAESRKKSVDDVKSLIDAAPYNANQAKSLGLIDDALYREQVDDELKTALGYKSRRQAPYRQRQCVSRDTVRFTWPEQWRKGRGHLRVGSDQCRPFEQRAAERRNGRLGHARRCHKRRDRRQIDQSDRFSCRFAGRLGPGLGSDLARDRKRQREETGRCFDVRCCRLGRLLHRLQRQ